MKKRKFQPNSYYEVMNFRGEEDENGCLWEIDYEPDRTPAWLVEIFINDTLRLAIVVGTSIQDIVEQVEVLPQPTFFTGTNKQWNEMLEFWVDQIPVVMEP